MSLSSYPPLEWGNSTVDFLNAHFKWRTCRSRGSGEREEEIKGVVISKIEILSSVTWPFYPLWNTKEDVLINVHAALLYTMKANGDLQISTIKES